MDEEAKAEDVLQYGNEAVSDPVDGQEWLVVPPSEALSVATVLTLFTL